MQNHSNYLRNAYVEIIQISYYFDHTILSYKESTLRFTGTTLVYEPRHEKTCLSHMRTIKAQISLRIRAVWSVPLLFAA